MAMRTFGALRNPGRARLGWRDLERMPLVEHPERHAHEQKDQEKWQHQHRAQNKSFSAIGDVLAGEHALDDELLRAVR